jgi:hypothetical protein
MLMLEKENIANITFEDFPAGLLELFDAAVLTQIVNSSQQDIIGCNVKHFDPLGGTTLEMIFQQTTNFDC